MPARISRHALASCFQHGIGNVDRGKQDRTHGGQCSAEPTESAARIEDVEDRIRPQLLGVPLGDGLGSQGLPGFRAHFEILDRGIAMLYQVTLVEINAHIHGVALALWVLQLKMPFVESNAAENLPAGLFVKTTQSIDQWGSALIFWPERPNTSPHVQGFQEAGSAWAAWAAQGIRHQLRLRGGRSGVLGAWLSRDFPGRHMRRDGPVTRQPVLRLR